MKSDFELLRIPEGASIEMARKARNTFARDTHQKQCQGDASAIEAMAKVNAAYDRIKAGNPQTKASNGSGAKSVHNSPPSTPRSAPPAPPKDSPTAWHVSKSALKHMEEKVKDAFLRTRFVRKDVRAMDLAGIHYVTSARFVEGTLHFYCDTRAVLGPNLFVTPEVRFPMSNPDKVSVSSFKFEIDKAIFTTTSGKPTVKGHYVTGYGKKVPFQIHPNPKGTSNQEDFARFLQKAARRRERKQTPLHMKLYSFVASISKPFISKTRAFLNAFT